MEKKPVRLYNILLPIWLLWIFPQVWLVILPGNLLIDCAVLLLATLVTGAVVSATGLIAFIGLLAPHIARLLTRSSRFSTTVLAGLAGAVLLLVADVLARSVGSSEVPVSIVTSLLGAPFLLHLMFRRGERDA